MSDTVAWPPLQDRRDDAERDFAALFAQLDRPEMAAPIAGGLLQLLNRVADLRWRQRGEPRR